MKKLCNLQKILVDLKGEPLKDSEKEIILKDALITILGLPPKQGQQVAPLTSVRRYQLMQYLWATKEESYEVDDEDYSFIEKSLAEYQSPILSGQIISLIAEPKKV